jgi:hypothetical protein
MQCFGSGFNDSGSGSRLLLNPDLIGIRIPSQIKIFNKKLEKLTIGRKKLIKKPLYMFSTYKRVQAL